MKTPEILFLPAKPYISDILWNFAVQNQIPVPESDLIPTEFRKQLTILEPAEFISRFEQNPEQGVYINSENAIEWINKQLHKTDLPNKISLIKDKFKFREILRPKFPNFYFKKISLNELRTLNSDEINFPVILKPSAGFSSLGVYKIHSEAELRAAHDKILLEIEKYGTSFPTEVVNLSEFILEQVIEGEEYAVDLYYNEKSEVTLLMALHHVFENAEDMSDRLYLTSKKIITEIAPKFKETLEFIGKTIGFKNLAMHAEFRITANGEVYPIEVNPLRFAGYCTTEVSHFCFNFLGYEYFFNKKTPNWNEIFAGKEDKTFALSVIDVRTDVNVSNIKSFDYEALAREFSNPIHIRKFDYKKYPVFAFVFCEIASEEEKQRILKLDVRKMIENY